MINPNNLAKAASITHFLEEIDITTFEVSFIALIIYEIKLQDSVIPILSVDISKQDSRVLFLGSKNDISLYILHSNSQIVNEKKIIIPYYQCNIARFANKNDSLLVASASECIIIIFNNII